jgi:hypothetical protein
LKFVFSWHESEFFSLQKDVMNHGGAQYQVISKEVCKRHNYVFTKYHRGFCMNEYGLNENEHDRKPFRRSGLA